MCRVIRVAGTDQEKNADLLVNRLLLLACVFLCLSPSDKEYLCTNMDDDRTKTTYTLHKHSAAASHLPAP